MDTTAIVKHFVTTHNSNDHKFKAQLAPLRKVAQRAVSSWQALPIRGADALPHVQKRLQSFCAALQDGSIPELDVDLLPALHPARASQDDPWAALVSAEERLASMAKSAIAGVSRAVLRKQSVDDVSNTHRRLSHLYDLNFAGNAHKVSATGVDRTGLVKATALVHEELERRGVEVSPQHALYEEALQTRNAPAVEMAKGRISQTADGVVLELPGMGRLQFPGRCGAVELAKAAEAFDPEGSKWHLAIREPAEAAYTLQLDKPSDPAWDIGEFTFAPGAVTPAFTEVFVSGALNGVLVVGAESATLRKELQPYVLTPAAVAAGWMPPDGESALPYSLELDVPPELRYWRAAEGEDAKEIRDQLVKSGLLGSGSVALVNGQPRRVVQKLFVAEPYGAAPGVFAHALVEETAEDVIAKAVGGSVVQGLEDGVAVIGESGTFGPLFLNYGDTGHPTEVVKAVAQLDLGRFALGMSDTPDARVAMSSLGRVFKMDGSNAVFVSSHAVPGAQYLNDAQSAAGPESSVTLLKSAGDDELRFVLGIVLEPETVDAQADIYSAEEIRKSAHTFMACYRNAGLQHQTLVNDKVSIVESYLAPVDMELNGQVVKSGTWLLGMRIDDDGIWAAVKAGDITGFSIGGSAVRLPD